VLLDAHLLRGILANLNLRPLTRAAFSFLRYLDFGFGRKNPACALGKRKRGPVEAGKGSPASEPTELSAHDIRTSFLGHFNATITIDLDQRSDLSGVDRRDGSYEASFLPN
jgi:hypothetical protein